MMKKLLLLVWLFIFLPISSAFAVDGNGPYVGQTAPEFSMTDLSGKSHSLSQLREKGHVLLVFWSTQCHVCHTMLPAFKKIDEQYKDKGLSFVAVNVGYEDLPEVKDYVYEFKIKYLVLNEDDKKADVAEAYRLRGTPTMELISPDGKVLYRGHRIPDVERLMQMSDTSL
jgi:thiol-disulfide isomerase/thioredoxin